MGGMQEVEVLKEVGECMGWVGVGELGVARIGGSLLEVKVSFILSNKIVIYRHFILFLGGGQGGNYYQQQQSQQQQQQSQQQQQQQQQALQYYSQLPGLYYQQPYSTPATVYFNNPILPVDESTLQEYIRKQM